MTKALAVLGLVSAMACSETPEEPASHTTQTAATSEMEEYRHAFSHSQFAVGPATEQKFEFGMEKVVGSWGVFATTQKTGKVLALPNADAPSRLRPALTNDAETHNAAVRKYFVAAGLPENQIESVTAHTKSSAIGIGDDEPTAWQFQSFTSTISRQYQGVPVVDSHAWAQFNDHSEVVTESVYWPEIPQSVLTAASGFQKQLVDAAAKASFFSKVPDGGRLVIHHTSGNWQGAFKASVSYDVGSFGKTTHFDALGDAFSLPEEGGGP